MMIDKGQRDELSKAVSLSMKMQVTTIRTIFAKRSYFFFMGNPQYKNPVLQAKPLTHFVPKRTESLPRQLLLSAYRVATAILND